MGSTIGYDDSQDMFDDPTFNNVYNMFADLTEQLFKFKEINSYILN